MTDQERMHRLSQALARIVSGAYVLTARDAAGRPHAIVLSFVQQVGLEPPRLVAAIHKERAILPVLEATRACVLNVCAEGDQALITRLVEAGDRLPQVLAEAGWCEVAGGWSLGTAAAWLSCRVAERVDIGDHWLYIADVVDGATMDGRSPLVHVRRSGLRY